MTNSAKRDPTSRPFGDNPFKNKWVHPPFRYNIEYPWTKWNIRAFQPYEWKHKPVAAHCPESWISSGIAEKLLFMDSTSAFHFIGDTLRPIVARCLEGGGYMFTTTAEYDSFHFGEDPDLKRKIVTEVEAFMQLKLPPWAFSEVRSVLDLVHWYTRRVVMARPWFQFDVPDEWEQVIDAEASALDGKVLSLYREHVRNSTPAFHTINRRLNSAETSDWEASHLRYDQIIKSEADFRKSAALVQPARTRDMDLWNFQRHVATSRLPAYTRTHSHLYRTQYKVSHDAPARQVGGTHAGVVPVATARPYAHSLNTSMARRAV